MSIERILVTPRWAGTPDDDWYPWLVEQAPTLAPGLTIERLPLPDRLAPTIAGCIDAFGAALDAGDPATTLCIGHSVSVQGWLRTFEARPDRQVGGLLGIAGWWSVDSRWDSIIPWLDTPHDLAAIRRACPRIRVLISTTDPYTADYEINTRRWLERLDAEVDLIADAAHFNAAVEPAVLAAVRDLVTVP